MSNKITEALELHDELNQKLFNGTELKEEVKDKLLEIANTFIEGLDFPINVADIRFLGSNASYNYNEHSDIDLHIISNFELVDIDKDMLQILYNACKNSFNNNHDITIKGIPVELYIEDMKSNNATKASYSLLNDEWVLFPEPVDYKIPDISQELQDAIDEINNTLNSTDKEEVEGLINKLYLMRKDGLASEGEASKGNCVFKELRNIGLIDKLRERFYDLESQELTLEKKKVEEHYVPSEFSEKDIKEKEQEYREYIATHIANVHNAYNRIVMQFVEDKYKSALETNLNNHDKDKSQPFIFDAYRRNHLPVEDKEKEDADEDYEIAWFYHKKNNPHHWEYWLDSNNEPAENVNEDDIKLAYYEMLCDWLSFGFRKDKTSATGESNEFEVWYDESKKNMIIHPQYKEWLDSIISQIIGYIRGNKEEIYNEDGLETMDKYLTNIETYGKIEKESLDVNSRNGGESKMEEVKKLEEGGMSRIVQLIQQGYFATISANISLLRYAFYVAKDNQVLELLQNDINNFNKLDEDTKSKTNEYISKYSKDLDSYNKDAYGQLKKTIRTTKLGYVPIEGVYTYYDTGEQDVEPSLFVSMPKEDRDNFDNFKQTMLDIGKTYFQESVVIGNSNADGRNSDGDITVNASLYDCITGNVVDTDEFCTDYNSLAYHDIAGFCSKLKRGNKVDLDRKFSMYKFTESDDIFDGKRQDFSSWGKSEKLAAGATFDRWRNGKNRVAEKYTESYKHKKLQETTYKDFKQDTGFVLDFNVKVPLKFTQESDSDYIEDEKGNDIEMDVDLDSLWDAELEAQKEVEEMLQDEDYLKEIFPNVGLGRVYVELVGLEEDWLEFNIGFSDIVDPVEKGNDIKIDKDEIVEQIKDLAEGIIENIGYIDARQSYEDYTGDVDEDGDPIYDIEYSDETVSFLYSINTDKEIEINPISENITESKKLEESSLSRILTHYNNVPFIVISAERTPEEGETEEDNRKRNKVNTLNLKNDIRSAKYGYIPVDGGWKEDGELSYESSFFVPMDKGNYEDFFKWGIEMCSKYNQYSVLISDGNGDIAYYKPDGTKDMEFKNGISFNKNTIDSNIEKAGVGGFTSLDRNNPNKSFQLQECIKYPSKTYNSSRLNKNYNKIVEIKNTDTNFDILTKYKDADYGYISKRDLEFILKTLYGKDIELQKGINELDDCILDYDGLKIIDLKQK